MNTIKRIFSFARKEHVMLIGMFLISFLIRIYFVLFLRKIPDADELNYDVYAISLLERHQFGTDGVSGAYITPFYPMFLAGIYFLFGHNYLVVQIVQALLGALVCLMVYFISKEVFDKSVATLAFFLMGIHYYFIRYGIFILSENLFIVFVALSTLLLIRFCKSPSYGYGALFGLVCSIATLTRSAYAFFVFMAIMVLVLKKSDFLNIAYKKLIKILAVIVLCFVLPVSVWTLRNYFVFKSFVPLGTEAGVVLYAAYNPPEGKILDSAVHDDITWEASQKPELEYCRFLIKHTFLSIKKDPTKLYKYIPLKLMYFFSPFDWVAFEGNGVYNFASAFILPLSFLGIILSLRKKISGLKFIVLLPVIYFLLITIAVMGVPRTRLPVEPCFIIFAAFFMHYVYMKSRFKLITVFSFAAFYFINYILYLNTHAVKAISKMFCQNLGLW